MTHGRPTFIDSIPSKQGHSEEDEKQARNLLEGIIGFMSDPIQKWWNGNRNRDRDEF